MRLNGTDNYKSAQREHQAIRDALSKTQTTSIDSKKKLTVKEYCNYMQLDYQEIWNFLR